jgi:hypothetical protein
MSERVHSKGLGGPWIEYKSVKRPLPQNRVLLQNGKVYSSFTRIGESWMAALFTKEEVQAGEFLAQYTGRTLSPEEEEAEVARGNEYLMGGRKIKKRPGEKNVVLTIDGDPEHSANIAGYANYSPQVNANANFEDWGIGKKLSNKGYLTEFQHCVVLQAAHRIPAGREVRVDYDMGVGGHPFRDSMLKRGISKEALDDPTYKRVQWVYPVN